MRTLLMIVKSSSVEAKQFSPFYKEAIEKTLQKGIRHLFLMSGNDQSWLQFQDLILNSTSRIGELGNVLTNLLSS